MNKYTYLILNTIFFLPIILFVCLRYWYLVKRGWKFIVCAGIFGGLYFFTVDIVATSIQAWEYNYIKVIGIRFNMAVLEELVWMVLVFMIVAVVIEIYFARIKSKELL